MGEFELIDEYFGWGDIGDDGAMVNVPKGCQLVSSIDTLIAGKHFLTEASPADVAYKALAVNLSDIAAMGAMPKWFSLALTIPSIDHHWLDNFSASLRKTAKKFGISLIGGDTTCGHLSISIAILGITPKNKALLRGGAKVGDSIYVSNTLGAAALALKQAQQGEKNIAPPLLSALCRPQPQVSLGQALLPIASACIDISDGLLADLGHILNRSNVGAVIDVKALPLFGQVEEYINRTQDWCIVLAGGDDYQLCWTVSRRGEDKLNALSKRFRVSRVGIITNKSKGLVVKGTDISKCQPYQHF